MSCVIIDPCNFTQLGLRDHLLSHRLPSHCFSGLETPQQLREILNQTAPRLVFISCHCFDEFSPECDEIQSIISGYPQTLFVVFMSLPDSHFTGFVYLRENIIVVSKALTGESLNRLLAPHLFNLTRTQRRLRKPIDQPVALSRAESEMLKMWMSGYNTAQISTLMKIKAKTISSHKGNIRKKINTQNIQAIHQLIKISDTLTSGIFTRC